MSADTETNPLRLSGSQPFTQQPGVFILIGERTNVAGSPKFAKLVKEGKFEDAVSVARQQVAVSYTHLDVYKRQDFAHQDFVRVVAKNGPEPPGEGEPFFLIDGNLGDTANLILDRVLDGDDLVFVALDLVERGIEGGSLARSGGPGDQHLSLIHICARERSAFRAP